MIKKFEMNTAPQPVKVFFNNIGSVSNKRPQAEFDTYVDAIEFIESMWFVCLADDFVETVFIDGKWQVNQFDRIDGHAQVLFKVG